MSRIQELRIIAVDGLDIPDDTSEGDTLSITAHLYISKVDQEWVDVTATAGEPKQLPGSVTVCTVATDFTAAAS